jgi:hypothetical protein
MEEFNNNNESVLVAKNIVTFTVCVDMYVLMNDYFLPDEILRSIDELLSPEDAFENEIPEIVDQESFSQELFHAYLSTKPTFDIAETDLFNYYQVWETVFNTSGFQKIINYLLDYTEQSPQKEIFSDLLTFYQSFYNQQNGITIEVLQDENDDLHSNVLKGGAKFLDFTLVFSFLMPFLILFYSDGLKLGSMKAFLSLPKLSRENTATNSSRNMPKLSRENAFTNSSRIIKNNERVSTTSIAVRGYVDKYVTQSLFKGWLFENSIRGHVKHRVNQYISLNSTIFTQNLYKTKGYLRFAKTITFFNAEFGKNMTLYEQYIDTAIFVIRLLDSIPVKLVPNEVAEWALPPIINFFTTLASFMFYDIYVPRYWQMVRRRKRLTEKLKRNKSKDNLKFLTQLVAEEVVHELNFLGVRTKEFVANTQYALNISKNAGIKSLQDIRGFGTKALHSVGSSALILGQSALSRSKKTSGGVMSRRLKKR